MMRIVLLIAAAALMSGCATVYAKPGNTAADFDKDREVCELAVRQDLAARGVPDT